MQPAPRELDHQGACELVPARHCQRQRVDAAAALARERLYHVNHSMFFFANPAIAVPAVREL
jgi:hypothetical protein